MFHYTIYSTMKEINDAKIEQLYTIKKYKKVRKMTEQERIDHEKVVRRDRNARYYLNKRITKEYGKEYVPKLQRKVYEFKTIPVSSVIDIVKPNEESGNESGDECSEGSITEHYELLLDLYDLGDTQFDPEIKILEDYFCVC
jgi:hypothetical protein